MSPRETNVTLLAVLVAVGTIAAVGMVAPAVADQHTKDQAEDYTDEADFTVEFPNPEDHYPGDQNEEGGSIEYFFAGEDAFHEMGAENGAYLDYVIIDADWIDYSACDTENTEAFGIDRGNDNEGTQVDEDLVQYQKNVDFRDDGITIEFYDWEDLGNDPPYMAPEDAIVAAQGEGSAGGPCLTLTDEPGWYQIQGFMNGTDADNGQGEQPSEDAERAGGIAYSNYLYVCECDSEEEAREELGPPPNEEGDAEGDAETDGDEESTPEPTAEADEGGDAEGDAETDGAAEETTPTEDEPADAGEGEESTPESTGNASADEAPETADGEEEAPGTDAEGDDGGDSDDGDAAVGADEGQDDDTTPTADDGPGFGPVAALAALLASALLVHRRR